MSEQNVEVVERSIDAVNRRDVDAYAEPIGPEFELFPAMTGFAGVSFRGCEGLRRYFEELGETWDELLICEFRGDEISRVRSYLDRDEAFKAVGLAE
jgi:ketosteroid isomerase-like protein